MAASWQRLDAVGCKDRCQSRPDRPGAGSRPLPTPRRLRGDRVRAGRFGPVVAGRAGLRAPSRGLHRPSRRPRGAHAAGRLDGLDVLIYGTRHPTELGWLPRSRRFAGWPWVEGRTDDPWDVEAQSEPLELGDPATRPKNIVNVEDAEAEEWEKGDCACVERPLGNSPALSGPGCGEVVPRKLNCPRTAMAPRKSSSSCSTEREPACSATRSIQCVGIDHRPPARDRRRACVPRAAHLAHVRHDRAERDLLLPAVEQDRVLRRRSHRPNRSDYWEGEPA